MKIAWFILSYFSIAWGIDIQFFKSAGVYFQHMGPVKLCDGSLQYVNTIDLENMERFARYLIAEFNAYESMQINPRYSAADQRDIVQKMIEHIKAIKTTISESNKFSKGTWVSNMGSEVQKFLNWTNSTSFELKQKKVLPVKSKMDAIKSQFDMIMRVIKSNDFDEKLLSFSTFKRDFEELGLPGDAHEVYKTMNKISSVYKTKSSDNKIFITLSINFLDDQTFNMWKVISLPIIKDVNVITLENNYKYVLTSPDKFLAGTSKIEKLNHHKGIQFMSKNTKLTPLNVDSCLVGIFKGNPLSIDSCSFTTSFENIEIFQHLGDYRYLFAIRDATEYTFNCPDMDHNIGKKNDIQGTGILTLNEGCTFKTEDTLLTSIKVDTVIEPKDKFQFTEVFNRMIEHLNKVVIKEPPLLPPLTKITTNFDSFYESSMKIDQYQEEGRKLMERVGNRTMPTRAPSNWFSIKK